MSQDTDDAAWRLARLHTLTNFGYLWVDSPLLDVALDSWGFLSFATLGSLRLHRPIGIWIDSEVADALDAFIAQTCSALRGFARLRGLGMHYHASPSSIQGWSASIPLQPGDRIYDLGQGQTSDHAGAIRQYVEQHGHEGQIITGILPSFDIRVTCRSSRTGELGEYWLPDIEMHLRPDDRRPLEPPKKAGYATSADMGVTTWTAVCTVSCGALFRRDNGRELARTRAYWSELQAAHPELETGPGEEEEDFVITEAQPMSEVRTNAELWSMNYPRLRAAVSKWERAMGSAFEWQFEA